MSATTRGVGLLPSRPGVTLEDDDGPRAVERSEGLNASLTDITGRNGL